MEWQTATYYSLQLKYWKLYRITFTFVQIQDIIISAGISSAKKNDLLTFIRGIYTKPSFSFMAKKKKSKLKRKKSNTK